MSKNKKLFIYLISQEVVAGYDYYDSAVVIAESEEAAKLIHPSGDPDYNGKWMKPEDIEVSLVGEAREGALRGTVICSSFNAG